MNIFDNIFSKLIVSGDKIGFKCYAYEKVGVFIANEISLNLAMLLTTVLCTLGLPYRIPGEVPTG